MVRGRLFSRKYEPAKPRPSEASVNPLVQLGLTFKRLQKLAPEIQPRPAEDSELPERRPLVDINDVRKYIREKLAITEEVSTIPLSIPNPNPSPNVPHMSSSSDAYESSETTHITSKHAYSSDASSLPQHDAATGAGVFDIGTVGHPILEMRTPSLAESSSEGSQASPSYTWILQPPKSSTPSRPVLDMNDVQEFVRGVVEVVKRFENWGMPQTSWENKMPWHSPPPKILSRGLQRPPERFASEEEKLAFNRLARKKRPFLTGCPPTWSFMVANFALLAFLVNNPFG